MGKLVSKAFYAKVKLFVPPEILRLKYLIREQEIFYRKVEKLVQQHTRPGYTVHYKEFEKPVYTYKWSTAHHRDPRAIFGSKYYGGCGLTAHHIFDNLYPRQQIKEVSYYEKWCIIRITKII